MRMLNERSGGISIRGDKSGVSCVHKYKRTSNSEKAFGMETWTRFTDEGSCRFCVSRKNWSLIMKV